MLGVRLDEDTEKRLSELAEKTNRSKSYYAKEAIKHYLDERADYEIAMSRSRDHIDKSISSKEMRKRLGV
jgi:RHH-type transcriptional regulator, rel operon repressor / antitoxin RelB